MSLKQPRRCLNGVDTIRTNSSFNFGLLRIISSGKNTDISVDWSGHKKRSCKFLVAYFPSTPPIKIIAKNNADPRETVYLELTEVLAERAKLDWPSWPTLSLQFKYFE